MPDGPVSEKGGVMELWDLTACCRFYQTGACSHTEDYGDYEEATNGPLPTPDRQDGSSVEPF